MHPELLVVAGRLDDERIAFPAAHGVSEIGVREVGIVPRRVRTGSTPAAPELYGPAMNSMTRECLSVLLLGLLAGCEKDAIVAEKPAARPSANAAPGPSAASTVGASEVTPDASAQGKDTEKKCGTAGCAPGKCG